MATKKKTAKPVEEVKEEVKENIFMKVANEFQPVTTDVDIFGQTVTVRSRLSIEDMASVVNLIVEMCTDNVSREIKWELCDYLTRLVICAAYCGIDVPSDLNAGYNATCGHDRMYDLIRDYIDDEQIVNIWSSVEKKLMARQDLNTATSVQRLNEMINRMDELMNMITGVSEGFDSEEAIKAIGQLSAFAAGQ